MNRKIIVGVCGLAVLFLIIQPAASMNVGFDISKPDRIDIHIDTETDLVDTIKKFKESELEPIIKKKPKLPFREKLKENRFNMLHSDPFVPVPDYDYDNIIMNYNDLIDAKERSESSKSELVDNYRVKEVRFGTDDGSISKTKTRAAAADLEISRIEWGSAVNPGWGHYTETETTAGEQPFIGGFMVGVTTKIYVEIVNNNPTVPVSNINLNFSIWDYYGGIPLIKIPTQVSFSIIGASTTVTFDFTTPAAKWLYIAAYIDYPEDTDKSNNGLGYYAMPTLIWTSDFEPERYGDGSQSPNTWTGDLGSTNKWHKTTTAANQLEQSHTSPTSYYHGDEQGTPDTYSDMTDSYLVSPKINMDPISDGQEEVGKLKDGYFYPFASPMWAGMFTGEAEAGTSYSTSDVIWTYEYTDDNGSNWKSQFNASLYGGVIYGDWETQNGQETQDGWHPNVLQISENYAVYGWPFALQIGDGNGGTQWNNGARNWTKINFRIQFDGDSDGKTDNMPGYYADDFVTWGYQYWYPPYNIRLSKVTNVVSNGVPILYPGVACSFDTFIENMGEALTNIPVKIEIKDSKGVTVHGPVTKTIASLGKNEEVKMTWSWTPSKEGNYYIYIEAGDLTQDYTPRLNTEELKVYVRKPNARALVVDDDNSIHGTGIFYKDVEVKMLDALDDLGITYNVFNVGWNESGPAKTIMDNYEAVIWMTGLDNEYSNYGTNPPDSWSDDDSYKWGITFKPEDQSELSAYLDEGDKNLWVISPGVLYDLTDTEGPTSPSGFLKDYFHIIYCNANETDYNDDGDIIKRGTPETLKGSDDSLAEGAEYKTYDTLPPPAFSDRGGTVDKDSVSRYIFHQNTAQTSYNAIEYSENYNLVYFAFNYYLIEDAEDRSDLAYRVLHFFGMMGGVDLELDSKDPQSREISFGETISFKFKVSNQGLLHEIMNLKLVSPAPSKIPKGWTVTLNDKMVTASNNQITIPGESSKFIFLNVTAPSSYLDSSGELDHNLRNITAGSEIQFKILAECSKYPDNFFDYAGCRVIMGLDSYVEMLHGDHYGTIDISQEYLDVTEFYTDYTITVRHLTNADDNEDINVILSVDEPLELPAEIIWGETIITDQAVPLKPRINYEYTVRVYADEHDPFDIYITDISVLDESGDSVLNQTSFKTTFAQYHDIELTTLSSETYSRIIDPNSMDDYYQVEEFEFVLENYGNHPDWVQLDWEEHRNSPDPIPIAWEYDLVRINDKDSGLTDIEEVRVPAYDKITGEPGKANLNVKITIPKEDEEGIFYIEIIAHSEADRTYINNLVREDLDYEDNATIVIQVELPELDIKDKTKIYDESGREIVGPKTILEGDSVNLIVVVENTGSVPVDSVEVEFTITSTDGEEESFVETVSVDAGDLKNISWNITPAEAGTYHISVEIDPDNKILGLEPNEDLWSFDLVVEEPIIDDDDDDDKDNATFSGSITPLIIALLIIPIVIILIIALFFRKRKKKAGGNRLDPDVEELLLVYGGKGEFMPPENGTEQMQPGIDVKAKKVNEGKQPVTSKKPIDIRAVPLQKKKVPLLNEGTIKECPDCGGSNPIENKFCQGCGGKLTQ